MASLTTRNHRLYARAAVQLATKNAPAGLFGHRKYLSSSASNDSGSNVVRLASDRPATGAKPNANPSHPERKCATSSALGLLTKHTPTQNARFLDGISGLQALPPMHPCMRGYSSVHTQQPAGPVREIDLDPYIMVEDDIKYVTQDIHELIESGTNLIELQTVAKYYFDGQGKALRPMLSMLMSRAINYHLHKDDREPMDKQRKVAMISEMIHTASLIHDDVIDQSNYRRGKPSVNVMWNHRKVTMAGDYIISIASILIARLDNNDVTIYLSKILTDLIEGELMQMGSKSKDGETERFNHYLKKTYCKTASLIANSLKSVAVLSGADDQMAEVCFEYGRNIGLAFQLVDDLLDFVSSAEAMGKPAAADLKLGLATAPVLFACEKFPELNPMINRRFDQPGDVERAFELVHLSQGLEQTRFLARKHCEESIRLAQQLRESPYQKGLINVNDFVLNRMK